VGVQRQMSHEPRLTPVGLVGIKKPGGQLFEFRKGSDHYACELRDHGEFGIEAQFLLNGQPYIGRTFLDQPELNLCARDVATSWANRQRATME
jgi:hypothetical protein